MQYAIWLSLQLCLFTLLMRIGEHMEEELRAYGSCGCQALGIHTGNRPEPTAYDFIISDIAHSTFSINIGLRISPTIISKSYPIGSPCIKESALAVLSNVRADFREVSDVVSMSF